MEYSVILIGSGTDSSWEVLQEDLEFFRNQKDCVQIIVSVPADWTVRLAARGGAGIQLAPCSSHLYSSLLNALKAVRCEQVLVAELEKPVSPAGVHGILEALRKVPSVSWDSQLQGYDTRLVMFCLQYAIEASLAIASYMDAVDLLADTPVTRLQAE